MTAEELIEKHNIMYSVSVSLSCWVCVIQSNTIIRPLRLTFNRFCPIYTYWELKVNAIINVNGKVILRSAKNLSYPIFLVCAFVFSIPSYAWWDKGHQIGCGLAYELLSEADRDTLDQILSVDDDAQIVSATARQKFIYACTRPDHPHERTCDHTLRIHSAVEEVAANNWSDAVDNSGHTNLEGNPDCIDLSDANTETDNLSESIPYEYKKAKTSEGQERVDAIKYFSHFLGDIQQPLHVGYFEDWIGKLLYVEDSEPRDFHSFWDHYVLKKANNGESLRVNGVIDTWIGEIRNIDISKLPNENLASYLEDTSPNGVLENRVKDEAIRSHAITQDAYCDLALGNKLSLNGVPENCVSGGDKKLAREAIFNDDEFPSSVLSLPLVFTTESSINLDKTTASEEIQNTYPYKAKVQLLHSGLSIYRTLTSLLNEPELLPYSESNVLIKTAENRYEWNGYEGTYNPITVTINYPTADSQEMYISNISRGSLEILEPDEIAESPTSIELTTQSGNAWFVNQVSYKKMGENTKIAQDKFIALSTEFETVVSFTEDSHEFCLDACSSIPINICQSNCSVEIVTGGLPYSGTYDAPRITMIYEDGSSEILTSFSPSRNRTKVLHYLTASTNELARITLEATGSDAWYIEAIKLMNGSNLIATPVVISTQESDVIGGEYSVTTYEITNVPTP